VDLTGIGLPSEGYLKSYAANERPDQDPGSGTAQAKAKISSMMNQ
jgi:hypothetical protein